jgi:hypothetical protein
MKTRKNFLRMLIWLVILTLSPLWVFGQDQPTASKFSQEELDQMLAPIALYPDSLLAQILMASTYPLEVVEAERWVKANRNLQGDQLNDALDQKDWDPCIKALVPFPQVLSMMSQRLEWTEKLGDAFLVQQEEVMDTVQRLRAKAQDAGNLMDTEEQRVVVEDGDIEIEPAEPEVVYVPVYDPTTIYGTWWYPDFLPFFFLPSPRVVIGFHGVMGFGRGIAVGRAWRYAWGHWDWRHHSIEVNIDRHININRNINISGSNVQTTRWQHDVTHRKGVTYRDETIRQHYGQSLKGVETRRDFRGFGQETRGQQSPVATRRLPAKTKDQRAPTVTHQAPAETRIRQVPVATRQAPDLSKNKSAFGDVGRGSDVRMQSNRGFQSRQSMFSKETGSASKGNVGRPR